MIWTSPAPLSGWCGVQNWGWSGNGRHCQVGVASRIGNGVESGRHCHVCVASRIGNGVESGRHCHVCVASRIEDGVEMDATAMFAWRPESGIEWKWTPLPCLRGVQNRGWSGKWTPVLCRCGVQNRGWSGKWTPLSCRCGVQNLEWSGNGRHCHVCVASRIEVEAESDATAKPPGVLC